MNVFCRLPFLKCIYLILQKKKWKIDLFKAFIDTSINTLSRTFYFHLLDLNYYRNIFAPADTPVLRGVFKNTGKKL